MVFKSFYKTVGAGEGSRCKYPTRLDTYGKGCQHNCVYCYSKSLLDFRKMWHPDAPDPASIEEIEKVIQKIPAGTTVRLGGMTDCFMPIERERQVTLQTLHLLKKYRKPYLIVTKSAMVAEDLYLTALDPSLAHIQISLTIPVNFEAMALETASPPTSRIEAIECLSRLGFDVSIRVSPLIAGLFTKDHAQVINEIRCFKLLVEFLRVNSWIKKWMPIDYSEYTVKTGGYRHLPLDRKLDYLSWLKGKVVTVCDDVPEHYEHFKNHFNPNKEDCCNLARF